MKKLILVALLLLAAISTASAIPVLDNANGGTWKEYIHIPITSPTTTDAQYKIVINGTTVLVYNSTGYLKTIGSCPSFWNYVNSTGADIRVTNQSSELYFWIQSFNPTTKQAVIWVNLTVGSSELNIYYGNPVALPSSYNNALKTFHKGGLLYKYYSGTNFNKYLTKGVATNIYYNWGTGVVAINSSNPLEDLANYVSIKFYGVINPPVKGIYTFYVTSDDGDRLYINGTCIINAWVLEPATEHSGIYTMTAPSWIELDYFENGGSAVCELGWAIPGGAKVYPIPNEYLYYPSPNDPATFGTPVQETVGKPAPKTIYINATYNAYDITGHLLINNSTTLLTPTFTYVPSASSATGYLATGSLDVLGLANITIYLDSNYTLNSVVCNGTAVTPNYLGTTTLNGINFSVYNFTSPSAGLLVVTANVTPVTAAGDIPKVIMENTPNLDINASVTLVNVNTTYGATIKVSVEQPLNLSELIYNGTELTIPTPTTVVIGGKNYSQYTVTVYNSSTLQVVATTPNLALATKTYADGSTNFSYVLVGEPFKVVAPLPCNVTLEGVTHTDTTTVTYTPMAPYPIIGSVEIFNLTTLQFGYHTFSYPVVWGHVNLTITPHVPVTLGVYSLTYAKVCGLNTLYAGNDKITVYYMGMPIGQATFYLNHTNNGLNITIPVNATNVSGRCYNMTAVSPSEFKIINLSPIPYGKFAVNHTGEVIITFENNSPVTVTVTGSYAYYPPHLYLYGSGNTTVTSYYRIKMNAMSAVGLPMNVSVTINGKKMYVYGMTSKVMPVDKYTVHFPANVIGFELKNTSLINETFNLTNSTTLPTAVYRVPTHIVLEAYKINTTSFKFPFPLLPFPMAKPEQQTNGTMACIEGTLYSWYGVPITNANITVNITSLKTGYTISKVINTGSTGTFSVNFTVLPGVNYSISASFNGTPVYIGSKKKIIVAGGTLPPAPSAEHTTSTLVVAGVITVVGASVLAAAYFIHKRNVSRAMSRIERKAKYFRRIRR